MRVARAEMSRAVKADDITARPTVDIIFGVLLRRYGIDAHAGSNTGRLVLAAELPGPVLADLTGISISTAERLVPVGQARLGGLRRPALG